MSRVTIVLFLVLVLLTVPGTIFGQESLLFEQDIIALMDEHDQLLEEYHAELQEIGEQEFQQLYQAKVDFLQKEWAALEEAIQDEASEYSAWLHDEYQQTILQKQLEVIFVTLSPDEREARLVAIEELQHEMEQLQLEKEAELQTRLADAQEQYSEEELAFKEELSAVIEEQLAAEYLAIKQEMQYLLEEEIAIYEQKLRRSLAIRQY